VSYEHAKHTFVTPVDLLQHAIDALEHNPEEEPVEAGHPLDVYARAKGALDVVTGMFIAETDRAYEQS
jgi:hypothetical protein